MVPPSFHCSTDGYSATQNSSFLSDFGGTSSMSTTRPAPPTPSRPPGPTTASLPGESHDEIHMKAFYESPIAPNIEPQRYCYHHPSPSSISLSLKVYVFPCFMGRLWHWVSVYPLVFLLVNVFPTGDGWSRTDFWVPCGWSNGKRRISAASRGAEAPASLGDAYCRPPAA